MAVNAESSDDEVAVNAESSDDSCGHRTVSSVGTVGSSIHTACLLATISDSSNVLN